MVHRDDVSEVDAFWLGMILLRYSNDGRGVVFSISTSCHNNSSDHRLSKNRDLKLLFGSS